MIAAARPTGGGSPSHVRNHSKTAEDSFDRASFVQVGEGVSQTCEGPVEAHGELAGKGEGRLEIGKGLPEASAELFDSSTGSSPEDSRRLGKGVLGFSEDPGETAGS